MPWALWGHSGGGIWALWGHSGGGIWSDVMTTLYPVRVAAVFLRSGSFRNRPDFPQPETPAAAYAVPVMGNAGVKEQERGAWINTLARVREYRSKGGPAGFAPDPRTGHETCDSRYLAIPFSDACLAMRLPAKGSSGQDLKPLDMSKAWLAPFLSQTAMPVAAYKGNPLEGAWLPNEQVARIWIEYVKNGTVADVTPPLPPFNVRVTSRGSEGYEVKLSYMGRRGRFRKWYWRVLRDTRQSNTGPFANSDSTCGVWTPVVPGAVVSRHSGRTAPGDAFPRRLRQARRETHLQHSNREQRRSAVRAIRSGGSSLNRSFLSVLQVLSTVSSGTSPGNPAVY